jgi:hypothetical protein
VLILEVICNKKREKIWNISIMTSLQKYNTFIMTVIVMITTITIQFNSVSMYLVNSKKNIAALVKDAMYKRHIETKILNPEKQR